LWTLASEKIVFEHPAKLESMSTMDISLPDSLKAFVDGLLAPLRHLLYPLTRLTSMACANGYPGLDSGRIGTGIASVVEIYFLRISCRASFILKKTSHISHPTRTSIVPTTTIIIPFMIFPAKIADKPPKNIPSNPM